MAVIAYWNPKTKEVKVLCTDDLPAIAILSRVEEDAILLAREATEKTGQVRAQMWINDVRVPSMGNVVARAQIEQKIKIALANHPMTQVYVDSQGMAPSADQAHATTALDISADFARKT